MPYCLVVVWFSNYYTTAHDFTTCKIAFRDVCFATTGFTGPLPRGFCSSRLLTLVCVSTHSLLELLLKVNIVSRLVEQKPSAQDSSRAWFPSLVLLELPHPLGTRKIKILFNYKHLDTTKNTVSVSLPPSSFGSAASATACCSVEQLPFVPHSFLCKLLLVHPSLLPPPVLGWHSLHCVCPLWSLTPPPLLPVSRGHLPRARQLPAKVHFAVSRPVTTPLLYFSCPP